MKFTLGNKLTLRPGRCPPERWVGVSYPESSLSGTPPACYETSSPVGMSDRLFSASSGKHTVNPCEYKS